MVFYSFLQLILTYLGLLVDLYFYPWFERWAVLEHYRGFTLPSSCQRLQEWYKVMTLRESVQAIAHPAELYIQQYIKYATGTASGITAQEMRRV